jgi:hypothetical protein
MCLAPSHCQLCVDHAACPLCRGPGLPGTASAFGDRGRRSARLTVSKRCLA